jgi:hypothetical protein
MPRLIPLSKKAKNRLINQLENQAEVILEQRKDDKVFVVSQNGKWCSWVSLRNDPDWDIVFSSSPTAYLM